MTRPRAPKGHRWFAATYAVVTRQAEQRVLSPLRRWVVGEATGTVLEIGAGTGASFPYYLSAERVVATEPDPYMLGRAQRRAAAPQVDMALVAAEHLPLADASCDTVVCTLVLCTVHDPAQALAEVRRVLKPGGTFRFLEHVRGEGWTGRAQDFITPAWRWIGAGCHPNRGTLETMTAAGFQTVRLERTEVGPFGWPLVAGIARVQK
jgi:ubiquinone/menaquinone biosynthesis C-methylase UbiE